MNGETEVGGRAEWRRFRKASDRKKEKKRETGQGDD